MNAEVAPPPAGVAAATPPPPPRPPPAGTSHARSSRLVRYAVILTVCALLAAGAYFAWLTWFAAADPAGTVLTATATRGNLEDTVTATGTLQPKDYVDVGTQVSGQLKKLLVNIGDVVKKAQLLAEIDPSVYQAKVDGDHAQLLNQTAQLADKQAQLVLAELQFTRQQNLTLDNATTTDALQSAEATRNSALAQVDSIKAQMQQTASTLRGDEANLGYTKIYAPIAGTVVSQAAKHGQTLNANQQAPIVMRIADLSTMTVQAQVSEADVPKLLDRHGRLLHHAGRRQPPLLRQAAPDSADADGGQQRRALRCAVRRAESEPGADDADDGAGVFRRLERNGRGAGAAAALRPLRGSRARHDRAARASRLGGERASGMRSAQPVRQRARAGQRGRRRRQGHGAGSESRRDEPRLGADRLRPRARRKGRDRKPSAAAAPLRRRRAAVRWCPTRRRGAAARDVRPLRGAIPPVRNAPLP